jgi:hypothetical protein
MSVKHQPNNNAAQDKPNEKPENFHKLSSSKLIHSIVLRDKPVKDLKLVGKNKTRYVINRKPAHAVGNLFIEM